MREMIRWSSRLSWLVATVFSVVVEVQAAPPGQRGTDTEVKELAATIDRLIEAAWEPNTRPAARSNDAGCSDGSTWI